MWLVPLPIIMASTAPMASPSDAVSRLLCSIFKQRPMFMGVEYENRALLLLEASFLPEAQRQAQTLKILSEVTAEMVDVILDLDAEAEQADAALKAAVEAEKAKFKAAEVAHGQAMLKMVAQLAEVHAQLAKAREGTTTSMALAGAAWDVQAKNMDAFLEEKQKLKAENEELRAKLAALEKREE